MNKMDMCYVIYQITNKLNGKKYIGQTIQKLKRRMKAHFNGNFARTLIDKTIKKHGKNNFSIDVLKICNDIEELNYFEELYIKQLNTVYPNGYNVEMGGNNKGQSENEKETQRKRFKNPIYKKAFIDKMNSDSVKNKIAIGTIEGIYSTPGEIQRRSDFMKLRNKDPYQRYLLYYKNHVEITCFRKQVSIDWQLIDIIYMFNNDGISADNIAKAVNELTWLKRKIDRYDIYAILKRYRNCNGTETII